MSEPFLGEVKLFSFAKAPPGWSLCNGAILEIKQNQALFALIGKKFGGDGVQTFGLPDLRGRAALGLAPTVPDQARSAYPTDGATGGAETVTLNITTVPPHTHIVGAASTNGTQGTPEAGIFANSVSLTSGSTTDFSIYVPASTWTNDGKLAAGSVGTTGGGQGHNNMQPFLTMNYCIASSNATWPQRW